MGFKAKVEGFGFQGQGLGFWVSRLGFRVLGFKLGFRALWFNSNNSSNGRNVFETFGKYKIGGISQAQKMRSRLGPTALNLFLVFPARNLGSWAAFARKGVRKSNATYNRSCLNQTGSILACVAFRDPPADKGQAP